MNRTNNYGLSGQLDIDYDHFLCGKKCRARRKQRKARRAIRNERKTLKNDNRRAETERVRIENEILKQTAMGGAAPAIAPASPAPAAASAPGQPPMQPVSAPVVNQAGIASNPIMLVLGVLIIGGIAYKAMQKKQAAAAVPQPQINIK